MCICGLEPHQGFVSGTVHDSRQLFFSGESSILFFTASSAQAIMEPKQPKTDDEDAREQFQMEIAQGLKKIEEDVRTERGRRRWQAASASVGYDKWAVRWNLTQAACVEQLIASPPLRMCACMQVQHEFGVSEQDTMHAQMMFVEDADVKSVLREIRAVFLGEEEEPDVDTIEVPAGMTADIVRARLPAVD